VDRRIAIRDALPLRRGLFFFVALLLGVAFGDVTLQAQETAKEGSPSPVLETVAYALQGGGGVWASWQEDYGVLPQAHSQFMLEVSRGEPWRIALSMGFLFAQPSAVSPFWYRYRGFWATQFGLGYSYKGKILGEWPLALGVRGSLALAQYTYSDSYFFFPLVEVQTEFLTLPLHLRWEATLSGTLSYLLRRDIYNVGGALMVTLRWYPWKKEQPSLMVSSPVSSTQERGAYE